VEEQESIFQHHRPDHILTAYFKNGKIPHALLFTGTEGIGKYAAGLQLAKACNCEMPVIPGDLSEGNLLDSVSCGGCKPCKKIESGNHPDVIVMEPSGAFIRIHQIRSLNALLNLKPYEAKMRVILVKSADTLNPEAGNALLKILEEPPDHTLIILNAPQPADLLPTIVSRCQHIRFTPVSHDHVAALLENKFRIPSETANIITMVTNGNLSKAEALADSNIKNPWINQRNWIIRACYLDGTKPIYRVSMVSLMAFAERLSKNKENLQDMLEIMKSWIRDIIVYTYNPRRIINKDLTQRIQYVSQHMTIESLMVQIEAVQKAQKDIASNANARIALEVMVTKIAKMKNEKSSWH
jgi:DNA polymerase-3 subunit delta'